jgi:TrpR-related protein YerC/YecD
MANLFDNSTKELFEAVLTLKTVEECESFFSDLCTVKEIKETSQRFEVAKLLSKGYVYSDIAEKTGASTATISRVNRALNYGEGGYKTVIERLEKSNS